MSKPGSKAHCISLFEDCSKLSTTRQKARAYCSRCQESDKPTKRTLLRKNMPTKQSQPMRQREARDAPGEPSTWSIGHELVNAASEHAASPRQQAFVRGSISLLRRAEDRRVC